MRTLLITLAAVLATAGIAAAQVAAPSLNPTPTFGLAPQNPATLSWAGPSRIGASYGTIKADSPATPASPDSKGKLQGLGAQYVGEVVAAGVQVNSAKFEQDASLGGGTAEFDINSLALAAQFGKRFSLGLGYQSVVNRSTGSGEQTETVPYAGATVRLGEVIYLGIAGGTATAQDKSIVPTAELKRSALQYGVAYFWHEKDRGLHVEAFHAKREAKVDAASAFSVDESVINGGTIEFVFANLLVGATMQTEKTQDTLGVPGETEKATNLSLGYTTAPGWAFVLSQFSEKDTDPTTGAVQSEIKGVSLGAAYQF